MTAGRSSPKYLILLFLALSLGVGLCLGFFFLPLVFSLPNELVWLARGLGALAICLTYFGVFYYSSRIVETSTDEILIPILKRIEQTSKLTSEGWRESLDVEKRLHDSIGLIIKRLNEAEFSASQATLKATKANYLQERFIRTVSEDIRTPLLNIITGIKALSSATSNNSEIAKLDAITASSFQLMGSINDALELGTATTQKKNDARSVNLNQVTQDLAELFASPLSKKPNIIVYFLVDHRLPHSIKADPKRLMHLLGNLVENAVRFTENGHIEVMLSTNSTSFAKGQDCNIIVTCSDTGRGIPKTRLDLMNLELCGNLGPGEYSELGLGLRAAHKIVNQSEGTLEIASEENKGTKVTAKFKAEVAIEPRKASELPNIMRFHANANEVFITLANIAYFHGIRPIPVSNPILEEGPDTIFIDASDLCSEKLGKLYDFKKQERYVVLFRHDQLHLRQKLLSFGFKRFLVLPLSSTSVIQCLLGEDGVASSHKKIKLPAFERPLNILVVDDVETTRLRISEHLRSYNHVVVEASDGLELVELLNAKHNFDLVFCDITMTHLDGISAVQQVREHEKTLGVHTPIVAMTAYSFIDEPDSLNKAGFDSVLRKPVYLDELDFLIGKITPMKVNDTQVQTQFIDLDDLKRRTAGKSKIMAQVLESFIETSKSKLTDLHKLDTRTESLLVAKLIHTIKGLLLEAGASESAKKLSVYEERLKLSLQLGEREVSIIDSLVTEVCSEAEEVRKQLQ
ncbi:MAG: response regulator [bacterium]|nr:response regulator [bacterium]